MVAELGDTRALACIRAGGVKYYYSQCSGCLRVKPIHEVTLHTGLECGCGKGQYYQALTKAQYEAILRADAKAPGMGKTIRDMDVVGNLSGSCF